MNCKHCTILICPVRTYAILLLISFYFVITLTNSDSQYLSSLLEKYPNTWSNYGDVLAQHIHKSIANVKQIPGDAKIVFVLLHEARNPKEFGDLVDGNITTDLNLSNAIIEYLERLDSFDKFELHFIYYFRGISMTTHCYVSKKSIQNEKLICDSMKRPSLLSPLTQYYSTVSVHKYSQNSTDISHYEIQSKILMVIDTRQNSQQINNEKLKIKLWHSYSTIDNFINQMFKLYQRKSYPIFPYLVQYNNNTVFDSHLLETDNIFTYANQVCKNKQNNTLSCDNVIGLNDIKSLSYQEIEYYITSEMLYPSNDYWITISDIVIHIASTRHNVILELNNLKKSNYENLNNGFIIIFIEMNQLLSYSDLLLLLQYPFILITTNNIDLLTPYFKIPQLSDNITLHINELINYPYLIKWYSTNIIINHFKLKTIPLGLKFQYDSVMFFGEAKLPIIHLISRYCLTPYEKFINQSLKTNILYFNFLVSSTNNPSYTPHKNSRYFLYEALIRNNFSYIENVPFDQYLEILSTYRYCMSPPGNGIDTHRTWECLMVGTIPILIHSPMDSLYDDLPVLIINIEDIHLITEEYLNQKYIEILENKKKYNFQKLYTPYWKNKILSG